MPSATKLLVATLATAALLPGCAKDAAKESSTSSDTPAAQKADEGEEKSPREEPPAARKKVGDKAPDFNLVDQRGERVVLADLTKEGNVAVVFYRSAVW